MLRKLFYAVLLVLLYLFFTSPEKEKQVTGRAKELYAVCSKAWEELDLEWHVHTFSCQGKKKRK